MYILILHKLNILTSRKNNHRLVNAGLHYDSYCISSNIYAACFSFYCVYVCVCGVCVWTRVLCICVCMYLFMWWPEVDVGMSTSIIPSLIFERQITWSLPLGFSLVDGQLALGSSHFCLLLSSVAGVLERCITFFFFMFVLGIWT